MESTSLASGADAQLILRLYELRRDETMRKARQWVAVEFWPDSAQEVVSVLKDMGSRHNQYLRQVTSYWEMAAAFVLRGALDGEIFLECNGEATFVLAKFQPLLAEIRAAAPDFLMRIEQVALKYAVGKANLEQALRMLAERRGSASAR